MTFIGMPGLNTHNAVISSTRALPCCNCDKEDRSNAYDETDSIGEGELHRIVIEFTAASEQPDA